MDLVSGVRKNLQDICGAVEGMKILFLDRDSSGLVSLVLTHTELLEYEIYLIESFGEPREAAFMPQLKAIVVLYPSDYAIDALCVELQSARFGEYHIHFLSPPSAEMLQKLAEADTGFLVLTLQEHCLSMYPLRTDLFVLRADPRATSTTRAKDGLLSALLNCKVRPDVIRYQYNSPETKEVAENLKSSLLGSSGIYNFPSHISGEILIIDRLADPYAPLLLPVNYEALIYEFVTKTPYLDLPASLHHELSPDGGRKNEVDILRDNFFSVHANDSFVETCKQIKEQVIDLKEGKLNSNSLIDAKAQLKAPDTNRSSKVFSKHLDLISNLSKELEHTNNTRKVQHEILNNFKSEEILQKIEELCASCSITHRDELAYIIVLYSLRLDWQGPKLHDSHRIAYHNRLREALKTLNVPTDTLQRIRSSGIVGRRAPKSLLFPSHTLSKTIQSAISGLNRKNGTQYVPLVERLFAMLQAGTLSLETFPMTEKRSTPKCSAFLIFVMGGLSYREAHSVHELNKRSAATVLGDEKDGNCFLLGSNCMLRRRDFLNTL